MAAKRLTIKDVAKEMGVSTATVSRAFSTKGRISDETREKIQQKALELGYRPNANARNLILQRSDFIGFFYPSLIKGEPDYFVSEIMLGINEAVADAGYRLQVHPFSPDGDVSEEAYKRLILDGTLAGVVILAGTEFADRLVQMARDGGVPYAVTGDMGRGDSHCVGYDTAHGAEQAGRYFQNNGRRHPAFVCGLQDERKIAGFKRGLGNLAERLVIDRGGSTFEGGSDAFGRLQQEHPDVDCVLCANDILAIGLMSAAMANGSRIPDDLAVIGCDDICFARFHTPALTTIRIPSYELGQSAVLQVIDEVEGREIGGSELLQCELLKRDSA